MTHGRQNARNPVPGIPGIGFGSGAKVAEVGKDRWDVWPSKDVGWKEEGSGRTEVESSEAELYLYPQPTN